MKKIAIAFAAIAGLGMAGFGATEAKATDFGFHVAGRGFQLNVGNVYPNRVVRYYGGYGRTYGVYPRPYYPYGPPQVRRHYHYHPGLYDLRRPNCYGYGPYYGGYRYRW